MTDRTLVERLDRAIDKLASDGDEWCVCGVLREAANALRAQAGVQGGEDAAVGFRFGLGKLIVNTGTHDGEPAVIVDLADSPGEVGSRSPDVPADVLAPLRLLFPTKAQARRVADALVNATTNDAAQGAVEAMRVVLVKVRDRFFPANQPERDRDELWNEVNNAITPHPTPDTTAAELLGLADEWERDAAEDDATLGQGKGDFQRMLAQQLRTLAGKIKESGT